MTIRNIFILSRAEAILFNPEQFQFMPVAIIRIAGTQGEDDSSFPALKYSNKYYDRLHINFDDCTPNQAWSHEQYGTWKSMNIDQAYEIARFVEKMNEVVSTLVVHCHAGISRSSAVALAVAEEYRLTSIVQEIHTSFRYFPNGHALRLMRHAFGNEKTGVNRAYMEKMYSELFQNRLVPWSGEEK